MAGFCNGRATAGHAGHGQLDRLAEAARTEGMRLQHDDTGTRTGRRGVSVAGRIAIGFRLIVANEDDDVVRPVAMAGAGQRGGRAPGEQLPTRIVPAPGAGGGRRVHLRVRTGRRLSAVCLVDDFVEDDRGARRDRARAARCPIDEGRSRRTGQHGAPVGLAPELGECTRSGRIGGVERLADVAMVGGEPHVGGARQHHSGAQHRQQQRREQRDDERRTALVAPARAPHHHQPLLPCHRARVR